VAAYVSKYLTEETVDIRLARKKAFFVSRGLLQPQEHRDELWIKSWIEDWKHAILESKVHQGYSSDHFGRILYTKGIITPQKNESNIT